MPNAIETNDSRPRLAMLLGDMTGIGPEIVARVLADGRLEDAVRICVVGDARVLDMGIRDAGVKLQYVRVKSPADIAWRAAGERGPMPLVDLANIDPAQFKRGEMSAQSGKLTGDTLAAAVELAKAGHFDAITFAPLNKQALSKGGWKFPDEHKMFAHLLRHNGYFSEMNVLDGQWMGRVTSHVSLREALDQITPDAIEASIKLVDATMRRAGIEKPRIAVAALNPHGGEGGLFGMEEIEMIAPTVAKVAALGIDCKGPYPADTLYIKAFAGEFDGVVSMFHDQGQIATKLQGFGRGVTITAGLETVFTTPSHGTAFDIVGKGVATTGAFETAVRLAANIARRRGAERAQG